MIAVIADDLTGAAELAGVGLRHGLTAEIVMDGAPSGKAELVCVDTDSRSCGPDEASRRAAAAAELLHKAGAKWIYKKVDSVLRGPVLAELEGIMKQLQLPRGLLVSANPSLGRTIKSGRYYIHGKPINKTEFAHDPEHPRQFSAVLKLLGAGRSSSVQISAANKPLPRTGIAVGEASTRVDVEKWAGRKLPKTLRAGAAEFFGALLMSAGFQLTAALVPMPEVNGEMARELFVCGTSTKAAREFIKVARAKKTPVFSLPRELVWGAEFQPMVADVISRKVATAFKTSPRVILHIGLPAVHGVDIAKRLTVNLSQLAEYVIRRTDIVHIYAEGGATAAALARRMGWERLSVLRELSPGVIVLAVPGEKSMTLTIKPGSYVWPKEVIESKPRIMALQNGAEEAPPLGVSTELNSLSRSIAQI